MKSFYIKAHPTAASLSESFREATAEELRVLVCMIALDGKCVTAEEISKRAGTSLNRARASITLWESEGAISISLEESNIIDEFEPDTETVEAKKTAETIRQEGLRELHEEIASIIGKPALDREEIARITALYSELALSEEYIITLAHHIKARHEAAGKETRLRVGNIVTRARALVEKGVDSLELLEHYIETVENDTKDEHVIRRVLGIWNRRISKSEKDYFRKWTDEFCFGEEIISEAYDIAALKANASLSYMNKVLASWHEAGCKTVEECKNYDTSRLQAKKSRGGNQRSKTEPQTPKYGNFDPTAALEAAIKRSFDKK